jgi:hypothetical protein
MTGECDFAIGSLVRTVGRLFAISSLSLASDHCLIAIAALRNFERQLFSNLIDGLPYGFLRLIKAALFHSFQIDFTKADHDLLGFGAVIE